MRFLGKVVTRVIFPLSIVFVLSACNDGQLPDLKGRYQGLLKVGSSQAQVISEVPDFKTINKSKVLSFDVYPVLASAPPKTYRITVLEKGSIELVAPELDNKSVSLTPAQDCASGLSERLTVTACWSAGKIDLNITDSASPDNKFSLTLLRDNSLPSVIGTGAYGLDELMGRAKYINYAVGQEAERVLQAKQNIGVARGNLLPKLSLKALIGVVTADYVSAVGTLLPFLFPSNWFDLQISKDLFDAERSSFASLRGNEMNAVEDLFYLIQRDQVVLDSLRRHITWTKQLQAELQAKERAGVLPSGSADYFGTRIVDLQKDEISLSSLVSMEYQQMAQATALQPIGSIVELVPIASPDMDRLPSLDAGFYKDAQNKSFELKSFGSLLKAAQVSQKEIYFDFFTLEGTDGIGFGTPYKIQVSKSKQNEIKLKSQEVSSLIELRSSMVASNYNQALDTYKLSKTGLIATKKRLKWLIDRLLLGDDSLGDEFINELADIQFQVVGYKADVLTSEQALLSANGKFNRLTLSGYYSNLEAALPELDSSSLTKDRSTPGGLR